MAFFSILSVLAVGASVACLPLVKLEAQVALQAYRQLLPVRDNHMHHPEGRAMDGRDRQIAHVHAERA